MITQYVPIQSIVIYNTERIVYFPIQSENDNNMRPTNSQSIGPASMGTRLTHADHTHQNTGEHEAPQSPNVKAAHPCESPTDDQHTTTPPMQGVTESNIRLSARDVPQIRDGLHVTCVRNWELAAEDSAEGPSGTSPVLDFPRPHIRKLGNPLVQAVAVNIAMTKGDEKTSTSEKREQSKEG